MRRLAKRDQTDGRFHQPAEATVPGPHGGNERGGVSGEEKETKEPKRDACEEGGWRGRHQHQRRLGHKRVLKGLLCGCICREGDT